MEAFLLVVVLAVLFIRWLILSDRLADLRRRIEELESGPAQARLIERIYDLESAVKQLRREHAAVENAKPVPVAAPAETKTGAAAPPELPKPEPAKPLVVEPERKPLYETENLCVWCGKRLPHAGAICECLRKPTPTPAPPEPVPPPPPPERATATPVSEQSRVPAVSQIFASVEAPSVPDRAPKGRSSEEWEAIVGGSWLNKVGVFVLVIGIALFLGYSFTKMGPSGRVVTGLAVSFAMLGSGIVLEKRERYTIFARGLLGGGWGALYFTTYAMYALEAAKVIYNPAIASPLLMAVAAGMILHSLKYRSQTVTGLAYLVAFVTLTPAISPSTSLSVIALVPLAASLLYISNRFAWTEISLLGLIATYGTCASRGDSGAPLVTAQSVFVIYWLLFEVFDLLRARQRTEYQPWERMIFPLNAFGFALLSYAKWSIAAPGQIYILAAGVAAAYLASAVVRAIIRPPSSFAEKCTTVERAFSGGYEGPVTLTAALTVAAVFLKLQGTRAEVALLAEAELFFLAGLVFGQAYMRQLGTALFAGGIGKLLVDDIPAGGTRLIGTWKVKSWTPVAALSALLFYINRGLRSADKFYGYAASAVVMLILGFEMPERYLGTVWLAFAGVLFLFGWLARLKDFRIQAYGGSILALYATVFHQASIGLGIATPFRHSWIVLTCAALTSYAAVLFALHSKSDRLEGWEQTGLRRFGSWVTTAALIALAWRALPGDYLGLGWLAIAVLLLELGLRGLPRDFRVQSYVVGFFGAFQVIYSELIPLVDGGPLAPRLAVAGAAVLAYAFAARIYNAREEAISAGERSAVFNWSSSTGSLLLLAAIWALLSSMAVGLLWLAGPVLVGPFWAIAGLVLVEIGFLLDTPALRAQGHAAAACAFARLLLANFDGLDAVPYNSQRLLTVLPVIVLQHFQWFRQKAEAARLKDWEAPLGRIYLYAAAILATVLIRFDLGPVLTASGWSAFALVLLIFGNIWKERDLRWQGYALSALAFVRCWTTDFFAEGRLAGIPTRIATAAFVIACLYAAHLLSPRQRDESERIERHARLYFSMLASVLLGVLLFNEVSGGMLTVAWGIEGIALLLAGFPLRDRVFRLTGLALFLICVLKLFLYDLQHLETLYRILSAIVLGLMLLGVSLVYTRFRAQIQRFF